MEEEIKRSTARRKSGRILEIIPDTGEEDGWIEDGKRGTENMRAKPGDVSKQ